MKYIFKYIKYFFTSKHRKGFGIHSPFVFYLVTFIIEETLPYYKFELIEMVRKKLLKTKKTIDIKDFGTGQSGKKKISDIVKKSSKNKYYAQILFRLVNYYKAKNILELGTSFGLTTMYLAAPNSKSNVVTMEGCDEIANYAELSFKHAGFNNIKVVRGDISQNLQKTLSLFQNLDFVFFDANHKSEPLLNYFNLCLEKIHNRTIFVIDDIYWSDDMEKAWNIIKINPKVRVTIDLFFYGIVIFDTDLQREDYKLKYYPNVINVLKDIIKKE